MENPKFQPRWLKSGHVCWISRDDQARLQRLLRQHHDLGGVRPVGEQLFYAVTGQRGEGLGVLVFCAASRRLRGRDRWIGWREEQRRRRLPLVVNNCRFLLLPDKTFPHLGSRSLRLVSDRLSADWQQRYGHPVLVVETFVDPEQFCGAAHTACGGEELGPADGFGRKRRELYVKHHKPRRLFGRELCRNARRSLAADKLKPALARVEAKTCPRTDRSPAQIRSRVERLKTLPDYRRRIGIYPLWSLAAITRLAHLGGAPRGVLTAVTVPGQHYLGSASVETKTNEIPVARQLCHKPDLDGRKVSLDALPTQDQTARDAVLEHGADFRLTGKDNQPAVKQNIEKLAAAPLADFSPSAGHPHAGGPA